MRKNAMNDSTLKVVATFALSLLLTAPSAAQENWPTRNVKFLVAFAPAGIADPIGRFVGKALQEKWGQSVVVENRGGSGGNIGAGIVARAEPDGYTVLVTTSSFSVNLSLYDKPGYALSDFQTVAVAATSPNVVVAAPNLKYNTLPEVIAAAKTENFSFGSAGVGTTPHLSGELIFRLLGKVEAATVVSFFRPAKTPPAIVAKFNADLNAIIKSGALDKQFAAAGAQALTLTPAEAHKYIEDEISKWSAVIKAADIKPE
jgi:tripartite-type tricarboxylate transporter receptor subunit TctC